MLVADDEANVLRVYPRGGGAAVKEWSYALEGPKLGKELDLEAGTRIGDTLYLTGSNSNKKDGSDAPDRSHLFAVKVTGTGAATAFNYVGQFSLLEAQLVAWDVGNGNGLGANHFGFAVSVRAKALIVPVRNYAALVAGTATQATFGAPIELELGGLGIRSIDEGTDGNYLIVAGPAGAASPDVDRNFALFARNGNPASAPVELSNDLDTLRKETGGSFESTVEVPGPVTAGTQVQLLLDNGDTVWPGQTDASKDLPPAQHDRAGHRCGFHSGKLCGEREKHRQLEAPEHRLATDPRQPVPRKIGGAQTRNRALRPWIDLRANGPEGPGGPSADAAGGDRRHGHHRCPRRRHCRDHPCRAAACRFRASSRARRNGR